MLSWSWRSTNCYCCIQLVFLYYFIARAERDGTRAETRYRLSLKRTSPFKSVGASVQSTAGSRGVRISGSNAGYTMFRGSVRVLATHSIRQFPLHFPSRASPCATRFRKSSTYTDDARSNTNQIYTQCILSFSYKCYCQNTKLRQDMITSMPSFIKR